MLLRVVMRSSKRPPRSLPPSPTKSPIRRYTSVTSVTPSASPSHKKNLSRTNKITKSQSESGLVSSLRKLSVTPSPKPPSRSKSTSPRKPKSGRSLSTSTVATIVDVANLIKEEKCKNVIVMAGAGISTPSGIPDFRTPGTGLYDNLQQYNIPEPCAIFDIEFFWYDPRPFFCLAKTLYPGNYQPNYVHYFVKLLHDRGLLLRMYTQNIDGLERLAGVPADKLVEAHGTFSTASCIRCRRTYDGEDIRKTIENDEVPRCSTHKCRGVVKPDVVFFGEDLPKRFYSYGNDFQKCDLLLVMGTSLEVEPFAGIVNDVSRSTPRLLVNRETVGPFVHPWRRRPNDVILKGDIVTGMKRLTKLLDWTDKMDEMIEEEDKKWQERWPKQCVNEVPDDARENISATETKINGPSIKTGNGINGVRKYHTAAGPQVVSTPREPMFKTPESIFNRTSKDTRNFQIFPGNGGLITTGGVESTNDCKPLYRGDFDKPNHNRFMNSKEGLLGSSHRMPLLPFRYTHRPDADEAKGNFKSIDMSKDLASAGFGLPGGRSKGSVRCFLSRYSDSEGDSSSNSDSDNA